MSYLTFQPLPPTLERKTAIWEVFSGPNRSTRLGQVRWYAPWRRYCYSPAGPQWLDATCLVEVAEFIKAQMAERADERKVESQ